MMKTKVNPVKVDRAEHEGEVEYYTAWLPRIEKARQYIDLANDELKSLDVNLRDTGNPAFKIVISQLEKAIRSLARSYKQINFREIA